MGDRLRLRSPVGPGAEPAAHLAELDRIRARLVRTQATGRQEMDEFMAASARSVGLFTAGRAGAHSRGFAIQSACRTAAACPPVLSVALVQAGSQRSPACVAALCGAASNTRATGIAARRFADAVRIRRCRACAESCAIGAGIHA